jgi:hypothetical protein
VWGDVASFAMFENQQLTVTYDGGAGELVTQRTIGGVDAFIYDNAGLLVITLLLLNVGAWGVYVDWKEKRRPVSKPQFDAPPPDPPALP